MRQPNLFSSESIVGWLGTTKTISSYNGVEYWTPARPEPKAGWWRRFVYSWMVFIGKYDVVKWTNQ